MTLASAAEAAVALARSSVKEAWQAHGIVSVHGVTRLRPQSWRWGGASFAPSVSTSPRVHVSACCPSAAAKHPQLLIKVSRRLGLLASSGVAACEATAAGTAGKGAVSGASKDTVSGAGPVNCQAALSASTASCRPVAAPTNSATSCVLANGKDSDDGGNVSLSASSGPGWLASPTLTPRIFFCATELHLLRRLLVGGSQLLAV